MTKRPWLLPLAVFLGVTSLMLVTAPLVSDSFGERFSSPDDLERPLLPELVARIGQHRTPSFLPSLIRNRFFPCVLFALATTATFVRMRLRFPRAVAWIAVVALLTMPRLFATAHTAIDSAMTGSCLLLLWALFPLACKNFVVLASWLLLGVLGILIDFRIFAVMPLLAPGVISDDPVEQSRRVRVLLLGVSLMILAWFGYHAVLRYDADFIGSNFANMYVPIDLNLAALTYELLSCPEWHLILAIVGIWKVLRYFRQDFESLSIIFVAVFVALILDGPARLIFVAPLAAIGAGRLLYRGTLTKSIRIPPAGWAMVLLTIAAVRSAVIMVTWAPHWDEYQNRIGLLVNKHS